MGIKIKNLQTGEFEKFNIPALKGEKGEPGEIEPSEKVDYIGKQHSKLRDTMNTNVDYIIKTAIGEFNYLDYEGQHITATNSIEGHAKSAILSGSTLVNICKNSGKDLIYTNINSSTSLCYKIKDNTWYYLIINVKQNTLNKPFRFSGWTLAHGATPMSGSEIGTSDKDVFDVGETGVKRFKIGYSNIPEDKGKTLITFVADSSTVTGQATYDIMLLEYQDGMENWDIPYFEGMQSVKMPVLTTVGKNLFDGEFELDKYLQKDGTLAASADWATTKNYIRVKPNTTYTQNIRMNSTIVYVVFYDKNKNIISAEKGTDLTSTYYSATYTTPNNCYYIKTCYNYSSVGNHLFQIEEGSAATPYEPFKSNILHTPEEVVLRSLPNGVKDTLNLNTGEYVQRIGEVVADGTQNWALLTLGSTLTDYMSYGASLSLAGVDTKNGGTNIIDDKGFSNNVLETCNHGSIMGEAITLHTNGRLYFRVLRSKLATEDLNGWNAYFAQNPVTVQYELANPVIKTVDLSDNHVYSYKGTTHYDCSSAEGSLVPTLSVKVPTDTQLTIQEQKATTQTLLIKNMDLQQSIKEVQAMNLAFNTALYNSFNSIREEVEDIKKHISTNENLEGSF